MSEVWLQALGLVLLFYLSLAVVVVLSSDWFRAKRLEGSSRASRRTEVVDRSGTEPWNHPYESGPDNVCFTCGQIGSYAHTRECFEKYGWPS